MLFIVLHKHAADRCPSSPGSPDPDAVGKVSDEARAKKAGIKILGCYGAYTEHSLFFVVETDSYEALYEFFEPLMKIGTTELTPASSLSAS